MITIIHGDDIKASRDYLNLKKQESNGSLTLDGASLELTQLIQTLSGDGLFQEKKEIFIEQLLSKKKKSKELDALIKEINTSSDQAIFLWEGKLLDKKTISQFSKAIDTSFRLPQKLFTFLDNLKPNNSTELVGLYHEVLSYIEPEVLFSMITRQMRLLLSLKVEERDPIEEVKRLQPWQVHKLKAQADHFLEKDLISKYIKLHEIDYQIKTGRSSLPLSTAIDIWLLKL